MGVLGPITCVHLNFFKALMSHTGDDSVPAALLWPKILELRRPLASTRSTFWVLQLPGTKIFMFSSRQTWQALCALISADYGNPQYSNIEHVSSIYCRTDDCRAREVCVVLQSRDCKSPVPEATNAACSKIYTARSATWTSAGDMMVPKLQRSCRYGCPYLESMSRLKR